MANINDFKAVMKGGGARGNQFQVTMPFPGFASVGGETRNMSFLCKATNLPGMTLGEVGVPFRGRLLYVAGDRTFETWTTTILNDTDFLVRNAMERWMNGISEHANNTGLVNPTEYQTDLIMEQLDKAGNVTKTYDIRGAFPINIGQVDMAYETEGISETTVEFAYQYWESNTTS